MEVLQTSDSGLTIEMTGCDLCNSTGSKPINNVSHDQSGTIVGRRDGYEEEVVPYTCTIRHLKTNQLGEEEIAAMATLEKLSLEAHEASGTTGSDHSNVIQGEAIQQLRQ
uniref:Zpr1 domain-containing protein n=1 Tax=Angiostrongylus cantonensis TaxID=6313 RepID=A0A0K0D6Q2_ANGCA